MTHERGRRALRVLARGSLAVSTAFLLFLACGFPFAGRYLIVEDPVAAADAIVVLGTTRSGRWLEALDLYEGKIAPHIVLSSDRIEGRDLEYQVRGVRIPRTSDLVRDAMVGLGVPPEAVEVFPHPLDNTAQEAEASLALARERGWDRLVIVTSKYHTRRARFAFNRAFSGSRIHIAVRPTRYEIVRPRTWWADRHDARWVVQEIPKLLLYWLGLEG